MKLQPNGHIVKTSFQSKDDFCYSCNKIGDEVYYINDAKYNYVHMQSVFAYRIE